jgi:hypothetical protein
MHQVANSPIRASHDVSLRRFVGAGR